MAAHLSGDKTMIHEVQNGIDQHAATCKDIMELEVTKGNRFTAKVCNFRMIYADPKTSWFGYHMDTNMPDFGKDKWKGIVKGFFNKYSGLAAWHDKIILHVQKYGTYTGPTGRFWNFQKYEQADMSWDYSTGQIRNYMVQGTSADIIKVAGVIINKRRKQAGLTRSKMVMWVHDSIIWDTPEDEAERLAKINIEVFREIPAICKKAFNFDMIVPIDGEAELGPLNWGDVTQLTL
jgi:DNA polymerase I-like protein with 3'-5' exonuclease and polymerase domains